MIRKSRIITFTLLIITLMCLNKPAMSKMRAYSDIDAGFEYNNNVTRERLPDDYQYGIIWRLYTNVGVRDFIPISRLTTDARYTLGMRDVNTTNDEDYNSHTLKLSTGMTLGRGTNISFAESFKLWNSQSDLFNFYDNALDMRLDQTVWKNTSIQLSYKTEQKWYQNDDPEVRARNFIYHQLGIGLNHSISQEFIVQLGYIYQPVTYNRSPIDFKGDRIIVLDGLQRDRQDILYLGFRAFLFNNTYLTLLSQLVNSDSNSRVFDFNGNRSWIILSSNPFPKLKVDLSYQIVAYNVEAYQTPDKGYKLSDTRTDDQGFIKIGLSYDISDQVSLQVNYEQIENTVFFTKEFYKQKTASTGLRIRF